MEGKDKYTYQQNFTVIADDIYGTQTVFAPGLSYSLQYNQPVSVTRGSDLTKKNGTLYNFQQVGSFLKFYFRVNLSPPKNNPRTITIKDVNTSLTSAGNYGCEMSCPELLRSPIQFLDGASKSVNHTEYLDTNLSTLVATFTITLASGSLPTAMNTGTNVTDANGNTIPPSSINMYAGGIGYTGFLINPFIGLSIVYEYF